MPIFKRKKIDAALLEKNSDGKIKEEWIPQNDEGELPIDAYETEKGFIIQSTIAGVEAKDLEISVEDDMLTIKGRRERPKNAEKRNYFQQECFWGPFSRKIILPDSVKIIEAKAGVKNGILTLKIPKEKTTTSEKIIVSNE